MNLSVWTCGSPITLMEILDAREQRAAIQQEMLAENPASLVSFTLNIAGPVKVFPYTKWLYETGCSLLYRGTACLGGQILNIREVKENTGWEGFFALSLEPEAVKRYLTEQEERHPLGRLFDFDVLRPNGSKISRQELGFSERTCLLCSRSAFLCGRSRTHSAQELAAETARIMEKFYTDRMSVHIGLLMQKALFYEVNASPKPGLVDRLHNGSHDDMCLSTFVRSAYALTPYFIQCARAGLSFSQKEPSSLPLLFQKLRTFGLQAEKDMEKATNGVNTHKGMIFSGGILCGIAGYTKSNYMADFSSETFPQLVSRLCQSMLSQLLLDYRQVHEKKDLSHGETLYLKYNITGIRGEAASGFPHVLQHGLPLFRSALSAGYDTNQAGLLTLLYYIAHTQDTNIISRSDYHTAVRIRRELAAFLETADFSQQLEALPALDEYFVRHHISPGGSADMLAMTYFMYFLQTLECCFE